MLLPSSAIPAPNRPATDAVPAGRIAERVREELRGHQVDPARDRGRAEALTRVEVRRYNDTALARGDEPIEDEDACVRAVLASVAGYGPLQPYLDDPSVEEIWINAPDRVFLARSGVSEHLPLQLADGQVRDLVERMLHATGRRVDLSQPFVDASLPDGSRLHVVIPDTGGVAYSEVHYSRWLRSRVGPLYICFDGVSDVRWDKAHGPHGDHPRPERDRLPKRPAAWRAARPNWPDPPDRPALGGVTGMSAGSSSNGNFPTRRPTSTPTSNNSPPPPHSRRPHGPSSRNLRASSVSLHACRSAWKRDAPP